ncbi:MAG: PDZ domain-containing protein, partial [Gemmataceae bacterium]
GLDKHEGALVEMVYPDTPAAIAGIRPGDVVLKLDNRPVKNENHCINLIADLLPGQRVKVEFWRNRQAFVVEAPVGDWSQGQARLRTGQ